jgi:hypothetical protein
MCKDVGKSENLLCSNVCSCENYEEYYYTLTVHVWLYTVTMFREILIHNVYVILTELMQSDCTSCTTNVYNAHCVLW